ncbi:MAG: membrane dipeptidase [Chloroflexi bacterium]|nr:membrane dipeptidase [Chloroflexota bacterium]MCI0579320.1 membrane dipeptidase [Chloroflexota bacterium]MCI0644963.1 membrane dipeptidase [Chloroflexota bacterium]MCI0727842.1 membrane dipeptidase [Chloroflexota bacterium]
MEQPAWHHLPLVDSHLDLAENVTLFGRDLTLSVAEIRALEKRTTRQATVSLPDLERGGIAVVFATVTAGFLAADVGEDFEPRSAIYRTPEEAEAQALTQIKLYERWDKQGRVRLLKSVNDLEHHLQLWQHDRKPGLVMLMEGADPIVHVGDLPRWWQRGLRMIGLTYGDTTYGIGVGGGSLAFKRGGLTAEGLALLEHMAELGFIWDISHLAEEGIWQGLDPNFPHVCASHANAQALTPTDRHLSDDVIRAVAERDGVIGLVLYNAFLEPRWKEDRSTAVTLNEHLRRQANYVAAIGGWNHVGIGSDLDGGFGLEESPVEIDTVADLYQVGSVIPLEVREAVLSTNWLNFLRSSLPHTA